MPDLTQAEQYGVGINFDFDWDFRLLGGSFEIIEGKAVLGRDLAFGTWRELGPLRGERASPELEADAEAAIRTVATSDGRINRVVEPVEVRSLETASGAVEIDLTLETVTGQRGEFQVTL